MTVLSAQDRRLRKELQAELEGFLRTRDASWIISRRRRHADLTVHQADRPNDRRRGRGFAKMKCSSEAVDLAYGSFPDRRRAAKWLWTPNNALGGKCPLDKP